MAEVLSEEEVFSCSKRIMLDEGEIMMSVAAGEIRLKLPTTRKVAELLDVPHYYVLPFIASLEAGGFLTRQERVGIFTTTKGTQRFFAELTEEEKEKAAGIFGDMMGCFVPSL